MLYFWLTGGLADNLVDAGYIAIYSLSKDWSTPMFPVVQSFNILFLVAVVASLAYITVKLVGGARYGRGGVRRNLEIVESISVGPQSYVHVIRVGGQYILIGTTRGQVTMLTQLDQDQLKLPEAVQGVGFESFLSRFQKKNGDSGDEKGNDS